MKPSKVLKLIAAAEDGDESAYDKLVRKFGVLPGVADDYPISPDNQSFSYAAVVDRLNEHFSEPGAHERYLSAARATAARFGLFDVSPDVVPTNE